MMVDTAFLVDVARGDAGALAFLEQVERGSEALRVPAPALAKFWEAVHRARHQPREVEHVREVLARVPEAPLDAKAALVGGRLLARFAADGARVDPLDALAAACALAADEAFVTRNARDFERVDGLRMRTY